MGVYQTTVKIEVEIEVEATYDYNAEEGHIEHLGCVKPCDGIKMPIFILDEINSEKIRDEIEQEILSSIAATNEEAFIANKGGDDR